MFNAAGLEDAVTRFMANIEDGADTDQELETLYEKCEDLGVAPSPCPLCGRYGAHSHSMD